MVFNALQWSVSQLETWVSPKLRYSGEKNHQSCGKKSILKRLAYVCYPSMNFYEGGIVLWVSASYPASVNAWAVPWVCRSWGRSGWMGRSPWTLGGCPSHSLHQHTASAAAGCLRRAHTTSARGSSNKAAQWLATVTDIDTLWQNSYFLLHRL